MYSEEGLHKYSIAIHKYFSSYWLNTKRRPVRYSSVYLCKYMFRGVTKWIWGLWLIPTLWLNIWTPLMCTVCCEVHVRCSFCNDRSWTTHTFSNKTREHRCNWPITFSFWLENRRQSLTRLQDLFARMTPHVSGCFSHIYCIFIYMNLKSSVEESQYQTLI